MTDTTAADYIRDNFRPADRLAVVLLNKRTNAVIQKLADAESIATREFQSWLKNRNRHFHEVYISMNALREGARGRTKTDVSSIRHIYLDFDESGNTAVRALLKRVDVPQPNYVISSSPGKWQVIWKVEGFGKLEAEDLQRGMAREMGADPAATDCTRVLRLPGFYNHKYAKPYLVQAEALAGETYHPERFPRIACEERSTLNEAGALRSSDQRARSGTAPSQSERDWAYAKRALSRGHNLEMVVAAIAAYRRYDKHNPEYYARLTVDKAAQALKKLKSR